MYSIFRNLSQTLCEPLTVSRQAASSQQSAVSSQQQAASRTLCEMSVEQKNFVVSFRNDSGNINAIMEGGYGKDIMDIMIAINTCGDFEEAKKRKIPYIQDYIYKNMKHIDFLIYLYGHTLVIQDYINRFGPIEYSPILDVDFATIIIDNIIVIYEAREAREAKTEAETEAVEYDSDDNYDNYSVADEDENVLSTSQIIYMYDNKLTEEDIIKFLAEN
jgi:hypothetical protein